MECLIGFSNKMILEGEIKDTKMSSFSSDFQTLIKLKFSLYFLYELVISLRSILINFDVLGRLRLNMSACVFRGSLFVNSLVKQKETLSDCNLEKASKEVKKSPNE